MRSVFATNPYGEKYHWTNYVQNEKNFKWLLEYLEMNNWANVYVTK